MQYYEDLKLDWHVISRPTEQRKTLAIIGKKKPKHRKAKDQHSWILYGDGFGRKQYKCVSCGVTKIHHGDVNYSFYNKDGKKLDSNPFCKK